MRARTGFTLLELLVVVVILAVLAAVVLPKFSNVTANTRATMLADDLRVMRSQLVIFMAQHTGVPAGYPNCNPNDPPTEEVLIDHVIRVSNRQGETADVGTPGYQYGPYMREIPPNPINGKSGVIVVPDGQDFPTDPTGAAGWVYQPATLTFRADSSGTDENGTRYFDY